MDDILKFLFGSISISAIVILIGKNAINKFFDAGLEYYKSNLEISKLEHEIRFSFLHNERAKVTVDLFQKLQKFNSAINLLTKRVKFKKEINDEERFNEAFKTFSEFNNTYILNEIYFNDEICNSIDKLIGLFHGSIYEFDNLFEMQNAYKNLPEYNSELYTQLFNAKDDLKREINSILPVVKKHFKNIINADKPTLKSIKNPN